MKGKAWIPTILLALLAGGAILGMFLTRDPAATADPSSTPSTTRRKGSPQARGRTIDERPLKTARALAPLATTPEEQTLQRRAERLGRHAVNLAFSDAIRTALENPPELSPEAKELRKIQKQAEDEVEADQIILKKLTLQLAKAPEAQKEALEDQLEVARAQLVLNQDELEEANEDLEAAGGDPQAKIRRLKAAHEAADKETPSLAPVGVAPWKQPTGSLLERSRIWLLLHRKQARLDGARQEAQEKVDRLAKRKAEFAKRVQEGKEDREIAKMQAWGFAFQGTKDPSATSREAAQATLSALKRHMSDQRRLADYASRLQDEQELVEVYSEWGNLAWNHRRSALRAVLGSLLWILAILLGAHLGTRLVRGWNGRKAAKSSGALRTLLIFSLQAAAFIPILFLILGVPAQASTVFGLAGAGLTVAMKDFIVAFFGWFVLMGKNGIRVGDWVEIKGVGGEVIEVGMLRTILLETGSLSDAAHPTGRRVAFVNSFAIEGHFFNFTTSGQWMWDELKAVIPASQDPYPVIEGIQKLVEGQTQRNAQQAEAEWQSVAKKYKVQAFSTVPGLQVVPVLGGIEVRVRYITRAYESHEARKHLNQAVLDLLHGKG
ncbi:MAG: mechanosensitive ion channel [Acidobacteria bacterium]|nr:mechanosensitive ion channel [Acidobacteriota bacterium]